MHIMQTSGSQSDWRELHKPSPLHMRRKTESHPAQELDQQRTGRVFCGVAWKKHPTTPLYPSCSDLAAEY